MDIDIDIDIDMYDRCRCIYIISLGKMILKYYRIYPFYIGNLY